MQTKLPFQVLRTLALLTMILASIVSLILTFHAGQNNRSILLVLLFLAWVFFPFFGLFIAFIISSRWTQATRMILFTFQLFISFASLAFYSGFILVPHVKTAFIYLMVPLVSCLIILIFIPILASISKRTSKE